MVKPVYGMATFPLTTKDVLSKQQNSELLVEIEDQQLTQAERS